MADIRRNLPAINYTKEMEKKRIDIEIKQLENAVREHELQLRKLVEEEAPRLELLVDEKKLMIQKHREKLAELDRADPKNIS